MINKNMFTGRKGHQGDTQWFEITEIPANARPIEKGFIARSERSGSVHALCGNYSMYEIEGEEGVLIETHDECILNHSYESAIRELGLHRSEVAPPKDHRHSVIPAGTKFFVGIHRRVNPLEGGFTNVKD